MAHVRQEFAFGPICGLCCFFSKPQIFRDHTLLGDILGYRHIAHELAGFPFYCTRQ